MGCALVIFIFVCLFVCLLVLIVLLLMFESLTFTCLINIELQTQL